MLFFYSDETFIPFGPEAGDGEILITDGQILFGPFTLESPLVFYLQEHHQLYVCASSSLYCIPWKFVSFLKISSNGILSFVEFDSLEQPSSIPLITTLWTLAVEQQNGTFYSRVTQDNSTLGLIKELLKEDSQNFQPHLAVVATWISNLSVRLYSIMTLESHTYVHNKLHDFVHCKFMINCIACQSVLYTGVFWG